MALLTSPVCTHVVLPATRQKYVAPALKASSGCDRADAGRPARSSGGGFVVPK